MKKLLSLLLLLLCFSAVRAQDSTRLLGILPTKEGRIYYERIVTIDSASKEELYQRAKRWVVDAYKSAKDVIQLDDPENGELVVKGKFKTYWQTTFMDIDLVYIAHTITIDVKEGKYRYQITDFVASGYNTPSKYTSGGPWEYSLEEMVKGRPKNSKKYLEEKLEPEILASIKQIKEAMKKPISSKQDW